MIWDMFLEGLEMFSQPESRSLKYRLPESNGPFYLLESKVICKVI